MHGYAAVLALRASISSNTGMKFFSILFNEIAETINTADDVIYQKAGVIMDETSGKTRAS